MRMLLVKNTLTETPGLVGEHLRRLGVDRQEAYAFDPIGLPTTNDFDGIAVFGSPESCVNLDGHPRLQAVRDLLGEFVRQDKAALGVCFGGQLLAQALGAKVLPNPVPEIGSYAVQLTEQGRASPFFTGFPKSFPAAQWHCDTFDLPDGATLLATSELCRNQAFSFGRCLAVQFHPEVTLQRGREWADEYAEELPSAKKTAAQVRAELEATFEERARLCGILVEGFLKAAYA